MPKRKTREEAEAEARFGNEMAAALGGRQWGVRPHTDPVTGRAGWVAYRKPEPRKQAPLSGGRSGKQGQWQPGSFRG